MALDNGDIQQQQCVCLLIICFTTVDVESLWLILVFNFPHPDVYLSVLDIWTLDYSSIQSKSLLFLQDPDVSNMQLRDPYSAKSFDILFPWLTSAGELNQRGR